MSSGPLNLESIKTEVPRESAPEFFERKDSPPVPGPIFTVFAILCCLASVATVVTAMIGPAIAIKYFAAATGVLLLISLILLRGPKKKEVTGYKIDRESIRWIEKGKTLKILRLQKVTKTKTRRDHRGRVLYIALYSEGEWFPALRPVRQSDLLEERLGSRLPPGIPREIVREKWWEIALKAAPVLILGVQFAYSAFHVPVEKTVGPDFTDKAIFLIIFPFFALSDRAAKTDPESPEFSLTDLSMGALSLGGAMLLAWIFFRNP